MTVSLTLTNSKLWLVRVRRFQLWKRKINLVEEGSFFGKWQVILFYNLNHKTISFTTVCFTGKRSSLLPWALPSQASKWNLIIVSFKMQNIWEVSVLWENATAYYLEFFRVEPLCDLVLNDGGDAGLDVIQNVFKLKFALKKNNNTKRYWLCCFPEIKRPKIFFNENVRLRDLYMNPSESKQIKYFWNFFFQNKSTNRIF